MLNRALLSFLALFIFLMFCGSPGNAAVKKDLPVRIFLTDHREITFNKDVPFIDQKGRVQAPVSFLAAELGAKGDLERKSPERQSLRVTAGQLSSFPEKAAP